MHTKNILFPFSGNSFGGNIKNNIAFNTDNFSDDKKLDELIKTSDRGYNLDIGDKGSKISGGQAQRVLIARALLKDPFLLILDEATSEIDLDTETAILNNIRSKYPEITVLMVTHRDLKIDFPYKKIELDEINRQI